MRAHRDQGHGGGGERGERGMAITGSDEGETVHYWQLCPLWARQRRIHKDRSDMKEGQSERKRSQSTTWKHSEVDTFVFSAFLHLQIFHVLRRLSPRRIWRYFVHLLLRQKVLGRKIPFGHATDRCLRGSTAEQDFGSHSGNHFPVYSCGYKYAVSFWSWHILLL